LVRKDEEQLEVLGTERKDEEQLEVLGTEGQEVCGIR
jgi:hypothetical protein